MNTPNGLLIAAIDVLILGRNLLIRASRSWGRDDVNAAEEELSRLIRRLQKLVS